MDDERTSIFSWLFLGIFIIIFIFLSVYCALKNEEYNKSKPIDNSLFVQEKKAPNRKEDTANCGKLPVFDKDGNILGYVEK